MCKYFWRYNYNTMFSFLCLDIFIIIILQHNHQSSIINRQEHCTFSSILIFLMYLQTSLLSVSQGSHYPFPCVHFEVCRKVVTSTTFLSADITLIFQFSSVNSVMCFHIFFPTEVFPTYITLVGFPASMDVHVLPQSRIGSRFMSTDCADVWPVTSVGVHVNFKCNCCGEPFPTYLTQ